MRHLNFRLVKSPPFPTHCPRGGWWGIQLIGVLVVSLRLAALSLSFGLILHLGVALYNDVPGILPGIQTMRTSEDSIRGLHHASPSLETLDYCRQSHIDQPLRQGVARGVLSFFSFGPFTCNHVHKQQEKGARPRRAAGFCRMEWWNGLYRTVEWKIIGS